MTTEGLRRGDWVEVLSPNQILATLDTSGALDGLPFMPEMVPYCGQRFPVQRRAEKLCDTIQYTGSRRLPDAVLLADIRCDGSAHDGCQAECRFLWKEAWLRRVAPDQPASAPPSVEDSERLRRLCAEHASKNVEVDGKPEQRWACQACELMKATTRLSTFDPRAYIREYTCGNVSFASFLKVTARAAVEEPARKLGLVPEVFLAGPGGKAANAEPPLDLKPGEWVQVKTPEEIALTLNEKGYNRGLWFDREMMAYCGGTFRVRGRVNHFIDDRFGKMVDLKTDAVTLESVTCTGELSGRRWFCPRAVYPYWRESWLRRVPAPEAAVPRPAG